MARIRCIKPEFWSDEKLAECSFAARLLFIGTWNFADDEGRMEYSPKRLKMQVFPGDNIDVAPLVEELKSHGLVIVYRIESRDFLCIPKFKKHQRIDKPTASKIPAPDQDYSLTISRAFQESSANDRGTLAPEGNGEEGSKFSSSKLLTSSDRADFSSKKEPQKQLSQDAFRLAQLLKAEILRNKPDYRITPAQESSWARTADRMIRLDHRGVEKIAEIIRWTQRDEFWMANILSMSKLREKFDSLELRAAGRRKSIPTANIISDNPATRALAEMESA